MNSNKATTKQLKWNILSQFISIEWIFSLFKWRKGSVAAMLQHNAKTIAFFFDTIF